MTIPGRGDLVPPHRHLPVGRYVTVLLVVALLGGGGYAAYAGLKSSSGGSSAAKLPLCPKHGGVAALPRAQRLHDPPTTIVVDNATLTTGLASQVADDLATRGFKIASVGNTPMRGKGVATIRYSPDRKQVAERLAAQFKGAQLVVAGGTKNIEVDVGPKYHSLQSKPAARIAYVTALASASPSPSPTATASPTCRPRHVGSSSG